VVENRNVNSEERIIQLEKELKETIMLGEESDRKFEEARLTVSDYCCICKAVETHTSSDGSVTS